MSIHLLLAGESWTMHTTHVKGFDSFTTSAYAEGAKWLTQSFESAGHKLTYIQGHRVPNEFPNTLAELQQYDVIIISDIGANSFLLADDTFARSQPTVNRLNLLHDYVQEGGSLLMIGGYLSFQGVDGKARYKNTPIEACLPVTMLEGDDRVERPEGVKPTIDKPDHLILQNLSTEWPGFLGYNQLRAKPEADTLLSIDQDPFLCVQTYGQGRTAAFASDCSPHWAPPDFLNWPDYAPFWNQLVEWLGNKE